MERPEIDVNSVLDSPAIGLKDGFMVPLGHGEGPPPSLPLKLLTFDPEYGEAFTKAGLGSQELARTRRILLRRERIFHMDIDYSRDLWMFLAGRYGENGRALQVTLEAAKSHAAAVEAMTRQRGLPGGDGARFPA